MRQHLHFVGVDPAMDRDQCGLCVVRLGPQPSPDRLPELHVVDLQRVRGTDTGAIVAEVTRLVEHIGGAAVAVDMRGVGRGVFDGLRRSGLRSTGVNATSGSRVTGAGLVLNVPNEVLFETTYQVFAQGRYRVAEGLPLAGHLLRELQGVQARRTGTGHATYELPRSEQGHGDLASALMLATLLAERQGHRAAISHVVRGRRGERRGTRRRDPAKDLIERRKEESRARAYRLGGPLWHPMGIGADLLPDDDL